MVFTNSEIEEIRIETPWGCIAAKCWNSRDSKPVIVVHGMCDNAGSFDRLIPLLSKEFYYVAVDLPGHGFSSHFPEGLPLDFWNYVHQLQRVIRHFGWKNFSLMGHSIGACVVEFLALSPNIKVEKLILLDMCAPFPTPKEVCLVRHAVATEVMLKKEEKLNKCLPRSDFTYEEAISFATNNRWSKLPRECIEPIVKRSLEKTDKGYKFTTDPRARDMVDPALSPEVILHHFSTIKCPVLIILGEKSEMNYFHTDQGFYMEVISTFEKCHPLSKVVGVNGDHWVHNNNPEIVAPVINKFLLNQLSKY